ncbi:conserved hypothetical protein [Segniliparus rotundus DSM 44985]|uniref:ESX-1 secretion-associated protein n=1 Tax=Segniliparus rotundus (strain ATCC BAA-972 / CDC 1076 / CIP 108378 / DSM 44985 / JCM 13578) TaxID=640132 RepID=D6ZB74_SEGRD|nr:hypothetical protein [Segniliparus rotundus]ADG96833.1 conserved hypothetical protein [Segniliparus rotundus DSM 44985]
MQAAEVRRIGAAVQGDGNRVGQIGADVAAAAELLACALSDTPVAPQAHGMSSGFGQLAESMNQYHDYLAAFGQALIAAAATYEKTDERNARAFAAGDSASGQAGAAFLGHNN